MAEIKYKITTQKRGLKCTGTKLLDCGHTVTEWVYCNKEQAGKDAIKLLMPAQVERHQESCSKGKK